MNQATRYEAVSSHIGSLSQWLQANASASPSTKLNVDAGRSPSKAGASFVGRAHGAGHGPPLKCEDRQRRGNVCPCSRCRFRAQSEETDSCCSLLIT